MPFFHDQSRGELRRMYLDAWQRRQQGLPLEPLQAQIADVIELHPEIQEMLQDPNVLEQDYSPEAGEANPFLHMSLHMAIREQVSTDRPSGIKKAFEILKARAGAHDAEHEVMNCLAAQIWEAQSKGIAPNDHQYLASIRRVIRDWR